jgi:hypothetical protein
MTLRAEGGGGPAPARFGAWPYCTALGLRFCLPRARQATATLTAWALVTVLQAFQDNPDC